MGEITGIGAWAGLEVGIGLQLTDFKLLVWGMQGVTFSLLPSCMSPFDFSYLILHSQLPSSLDFSLFSPSFFLPSS